MKSRILTLIALALVLASGAYAQATPQTTALAKKIVDMQLEDAKPELEALNKKIKNDIAKETDPEKKEVMEKMFAGGLFDKDDMEIISTEISKKMAERFTESELQQTIAFLTSPAGVKFRAVSDDIKKDMMPIVFQILGRKLAQVK